MSAPSSRALYRAAGQAIGALLVGAQIDRVSVDGGAAINWPAPPGLRRPGAEILAEILITLAGVGAQSRYGFGAIPETSISLMPRPDDPPGMKDVERADSLSIDLDADGLAVLDAVWAYAAALVCQGDIWAAVDAVAESLEGSTLDGGEVMRLAAEAANHDARTSGPRRASS